MDADKILGGLMGLAALVSVAVLCLGLGLGIYGRFEAVLVGVLSASLAVGSFYLMGDD